EKWGLAREEQDEYALRSHRRGAPAPRRRPRPAPPGPAPGAPPPTGVAGAGEAAGRSGGGGGVGGEEGVRRDTSMEKLAGLKPAFKPDGQVTAGNSSQISDGAAALLLASRAAAERLGLRPLARFAGFALAGVDPVLMLTG